MLSLAVAVVAIALPDCSNPSLIAAQLLLAAGQHPARRTTEFALAAFIVTFLVGFALALVFRGDRHDRRLERRDRGKGVAAVLYCVVYTLPLIGIAVVCAAMGQRAKALLRPVVDWLFARWPLIVGPLAAVIGVGLAAYRTVRLRST